MHIETSPTAEPQPELVIGYIDQLNYSTPYFLFSTRRLLAQIGEFRKWMPDVAVHYAMKANPAVHLLSTLANAGCGFEVASLSEFELLLGLGISPARIIYGHSVKPAAYIKEASRRGIDRFACDSESELEKIAACAKGARVYVRLAVNDDASVFKFSEKFGAARDDVVALLATAGELGLQPYGLSFHVGSQCRSAKAWRAALQDVRGVMLDLEDKGVRIEVVNLGGGFPCQYSDKGGVPTIEDIANVIWAECACLPYSPKLLIEPGRAMVAEAGVLVVSVIARVRRGSSTWLFLDAGVYSGLFEAMAYQGATMYPVQSTRPIGSSGTATFSLAGPTNDPPDVILRGVCLPSDIDVGDKLVFRNVGAYSSVMTCEFNGFPKPQVYFV